MVAYHCLQLQHVVHAADLSKQITGRSLAKAEPGLAAKSGRDDRENVHKAGRGFGGAVGPSGVCGLCTKDPSRGRPTSVASRPAARTAPGSPSASRRHPSRHAGEVGQRAVILMGTRYTLIEFPISHGKAS